MGRPRKERKHCKECGGEMDRRNKSFCSRSCRNVYESRVPKEIDKICVVCGKSFIANRPTRKYCSDECNWKAQAKRRSKNQSKPGQSVWRHRRPVIASNQRNLCWLCGEDFGQRYDIHHLDYGDYSPYSENVVALCRSCHNHIHHVTVSVNEDGELTFHGKAIDLLRRN